jgi:hypothetical protein
MFKGFLNSSLKKGWKVTLLKVTLPTFSRKIKREDPTNGKIEKSSEPKKVV